MSFEQCALILCRQHGTRQRVQSSERLPFGRAQDPNRYSYRQRMRIRPRQRGDATVSGLCLPLHLAPSIEISRRSTCSPGATSFSKLIDGAIFLQAGHHWNWASELTF